MNIGSVDVIGGGPAGLYAARLINLAAPETRVTVFERLGHDAETFGFGVGLTESTMLGLEAADPVTAKQIRETAYAGHTLAFRSEDGDVHLHGARNLAIGRGELLRILRHAAATAGVDYRPGVVADPASRQADVIIAADGVRSAARASLADALGVRARLGRTHFVWCGADFAVDTAFFCAMQAPEGLFVAHAYPYAEDRSTFLIEADEQTWAEAGLHAFDTSVPPGGTDHQSVSLLEKVFARQLRGRGLLTNRTRWGRFTSLELDRWSTGNVVLIGDAAHTAHYTLGSGTKLALEDAIALADALKMADSFGEGFAQYEAHRRPPVERFSWLAGRSERWWDTYRLRADLGTPVVALSYMTRAGNLGIAEYAADQPDVVWQALEPLGCDVPGDPAELDDWVLSREISGGPLDGRTRALSSLRGLHTTVLNWVEADVWSEKADLLVRSLEAESASLVVLVRGANRAEAVGAQIDLAERIKLETDRRVVVEMSADARRQGAAAIAARRCDAVLFDG